MSQKKKHISIEHDDYVMSLACLTALRSPDPNTKVGACILNKDRRIVGLGFNDFPKRQDRNINNRYELPFDREYERSDEILGTKYPYICHAAENAILNKNSTTLEDCKMFTNILPCNECFKLIVQSGIKVVHYINKYKDAWKSSKQIEESIKGSENIAEICGVELIQYDAKNIKSIEMLESLFDQESFDSLPQDLEMNEQRLETKNEIPEKLVKLGFNPKYNARKSEQVLSEKDYFMLVAQLSSYRSKDPEKQVGACIVDKNGRVVSLGYNGFPNNHKDIFPWENHGEKNVNCKHMYVCHAELNAIVDKYDAEIAGCTLYCTLHPCSNCARLIIQSQIKEVFYFEFSNKKKKNPEFQASLVLFDKYNVKCTPYKPKILETDLKSVLSDDNLDDHEDLLSDLIEMYQDLIND